MSWLQTYTGRRLYFTRPDPAQLCIRDIAHGLSLICRFNGQVKTFYSVAQHSVIVSCMVEPRHALAGLLHDAAEAYLPDMPSPLKQLLPDFKQLEQGVMRAIATRFGVAWPLPKAVKAADERALATEARDLMPVPAGVWGIAAEPLGQSIKPLLPEQAEALFLKQFDKLYRPTALVCQAG